MNSPILAGVGAFVASLAVFVVAWAVTGSSHIALIAQLSTMPFVAAAGILFAIHLDERPRA